MRIHRREVLAALAAGALFSGRTAISGAQGVSREETDAETAIRAVLGGRTAQSGRVTVELPTVAGSGNSVPLTVRAESPMTEKDFVRRLIVFAERNPRPHLFTVTLSPRSGRAEISTRIRLSRTQKVIAFAEMSDGSLWRGEAPVEVTIGACDSTLFRF